MGVRACKRVSERFGSPAGGSHEEGRHKMKGVVVVSVCREVHRMVAIYVRSKQSRAEPH